MFNLRRRSVLFIVTIIQLSGGWLFSQQANKPNGTTTPGATITIPTRTPYVQPVINYVRVWEPMGPYTIPADVISASYRDVRLTTQYVDGLGRPLQTVSRQSSPTAKDVVAPVVYDEFGREAKKYLPYVQTTGTSNGSFKLNPFNEQAAFYQSSTYNPGLTGEQVFFSQTNYEPSPLYRVTKSMAPGNSWAGSGKGTGMEYLVNTLNDQVIVWTIGYAPLNNNNDDATNIPVAGSPYGPGELYKNVTIDEDNHSVVEYKDKDGQVVLKKVQVGSNAASDKTGYTGFLSTYYVYDDLNQLRCVIPPKAVESMPSGGWSLDADKVKELCFRYEYDSRQRMIAKKVPGGGWVYMVYDKRDRLVFTQDANLRTNNQWMTTLYDGLNRPVTTGITTYIGDRDQLQTIVTAQTGNGTPGDVGVGGSVEANPEYNLREPGKTEYKALNSITFNPGFVSEDGADFTTLIDPNLTGTNENIEIVDNPLPPDHNFILLTITYYDKYDSWVGNKTYSTVDNSKLDAGANMHAEQIPSNASLLTTGFITGTKVRVLENPANLTVGGWLTTVNYYDDKGRVIQAQADNYKGGKDVATTMYDFTGKALSTYLLHQNPASATTPETRVETNMAYDFGGRLLEIKKTINDNNNSAVTIAKNEYDELGQLRKKDLGQKKNGTAYTTAPIGTFDYSYNIRGWLTGMNKDFANPTGPGAGIGTGKWFGMQLNYDHGFDLNQFNGNIAGAKWRSEGDGQQRAYGYTYDMANRLLGADFSEGSSNNYAENPNVRFDVVMGDGINGSAAYDPNGNIKSMKQSGMKGLNASEEIDNLTYKYFTNSNKLQSVSETVTGIDHKLGDFTDKNTGDDYGYDKNGNLVTDLNKKIGSTAGVDLPSGGAITYNHLNLPTIINVKDDAGNARGTITYIYDATGNKLEKRVHELPLASNNNKTRNITTTYLSGFNYETKSISPQDPVAPDYNNKLQFFAHKEGRVRVEKPATETLFHYDYFVKDHLGNVRMVLTDEQQETPYLASMETALRTKEEQVFQNIGSTAVPKPGGYPEDETTNPNEFVSELNGNDKKIGPALVLKVMTGDKFNIAVKAFYRAPPDNVHPEDILGDVLTALATGIVGNIGDLKGSALSLKDPSGPLYGAMRDFIDNDNQGDPLKPKAFLNYVFFDDQFNKLPNSGSIQVGGPGQIDPPLAVSNLTAQKNGFIYIYVSNESKGWNVFFDNLQVNHIKSPLLEETHYYPFGLTMAGISSKAVGKLENKFKYNGIESADDLGIEIYDAQLRELDPQTGRWWQVDSKTESMEMWSPYASNYDNPIRYTDPLGDEGQDCCWAEIKAVLAQMGENASNNLKQWGNRIESVTDQMGDNAKARWEARADPLHQTMDNPFSMLGGSAGAEMNLTKGVIRIEANSLKTVAATDVKKIVNIETAGISETAKTTETVQRAMSIKELNATKKTGLIRGGREGTHYVSDAIGNDAKRIRQRAALPQTPQVKVTMEVPSGSFSKPTKVEPNYNMPGGGLERTATGKIPVKIIDIKNLNNTGN